MATVKCEYCNFEQDIEKSRICDQCGKRISRAPEKFSVPAPAAAPKKDSEQKRCPNCGIQTTRDICASCGAPVKDRAL